MVALLMTLTNLVGKPDYVFVLLDWGSAKDNQSIDEAVKYLEDAFRTGAPEDKSDKTNHVLMADPEIRRLVVQGRCVFVNCAWGLRAETNKRQGNLSKQVLQKGWSITSVLLDQLEPATTVFMHGDLQCGGNPPHPRFCETNSTYPMARAWEVWDKYCGVISHPLRLTANAKAMDVAHPSTLFKQWRKLNDAFIS